MWRQQSWRPGHRPLGGAPASAAVQPRCRLRAFRESSPSHSPALRIVGEIQSRRCNLEGETVGSPGLTNYNLFDRLFV